MKRVASTIFFVGLTFAAVDARQSSRALLSASPFESYLEPLRLQAGIPGMTALIVHEGEVVFERGFGFQNVEARIRAIPDTPYPIGDLSQTIGAVLVLQCVEGRRIDLDSPVLGYGVSTLEAGVTARHVLSHTSTMPPGEVFRYDPERFARLTDVVERCDAQPYRKVVVEGILDQLAMQDSVPGRDVAIPDTIPPGMFEAARLERYARVLERTAIPYRVDKKGRPTRTDLPAEGINAATGLISTARDLARFDAALDTFLLLDETRNAAWTNVVGADNLQLPTGLGWFVQSYRGERIVWHFGSIPGAYSSLVVKVPARRLTFILLANSDGLSAPFQLQLGDVTRSLFATLFLRLFV